MGAEYMGLFRSVVHGSTMPPKQQAKGGKAGQKAGKPSGGGKAKKKKWSKGKVRDKFYKEVPNYKLITPAVVSERLKIRGSLARRALIELQGKGLIKQVVKHSSQVIYTRATSAAE